MPHRVIVTRKAERNLEEIGDYIALDNPQKARETLLRLQSHIEGLAEFPERHRIREDLGRDRRILVVGSYLVVYRIEDDSVYILRVSQGSRDLTQLLRGDEAEPS